MSDDQPTEPEQENVIDLPPGKPGEIAPDGKPYRDPDQTAPLPGEIAPDGRPYRDPHWVPQQTSTPT